MTASLDSALASVRRLEALALPDEQPNIEAPPTSVVYDVSFDTNFEDRNAFVTGLAKFMEEATVHNHLNKLLEEGEMYASMLYTWRSSSRAVPSVKSNEQPNRREIYEKTVEVLQPEVEKLKGFMRFQERAIETFTAEIKQLAHENKRRDFISETHLLTLSKFINMFAILDALKNMKACLNNDLAFYKRADGFLKRGAAVDAAAMQEFPALSLFLATNNKITLNLKESLEGIPSYEEVLATIVNSCVSHLETKSYMLPKEKHMLLKVIGFSLFLMDGTVSIYKLDAKKKISLSKIDKFFKQVAVVPLFGDMQIALVSYIKQTKNYDASKWSCVSEQAEEKAFVQHYNIQSKIDTIRTEHLKYISELARYNNEITTSGSTTWTDKQVQELSDLSLRGLHLISGWSTQIVELYAWKLLHPTDKYANRECPDDAEEYERATRYNYTSNEKFALVEVIAMIKGLTVLLTRMEVTFIEAINRYVHMVLQVFVQVTLRDAIRYAIKKKKQQLKIVLFAIRDTCVDWANGKEPADDPALRGEKDPKGGFHIDVSRRSVAPSTTQLYMCRTMVESIISDQAGKKSLRSDLDQRHIPDLEEFLKVTYFFPYMINFNRSLMEASDLSQLWYREFFLELTMGKRIQFPIDMSLPWILTDHILETKEPSMMEYLLYPLDLYSDAGHYALHFFKKQYLYDEVEAEVNLVFDQFIYKISEQIFIYFKSLACSILLDKKFRIECQDSQRIPFPQANRYQTILKQRHVQILGRSIDLNRLISQRLTNHMLKALDMAISRFESSDLTNIMELELLLETNALTHQMLLGYVTMDPFDSLLREANQSVNLPHGRITLHCFWEINTDFMPGWVYNSTTNRFVRTKLPLTEPATRESPPKGPMSFFYGTRALNSAYSTINSLHSGFLGHGHFSAMSRLLGYQGIAMIIEELLKQTNLCIQNTLQPYVSALMEGMPRRCQQPLSDYGASGVLGFYYAQLESIIQYRSLRTEVFQSFKEIGNAILFCLIVEQCLSQEEVLDLLQAAPFQGVLPRPYVKDGMTQEQAIQDLQEQYSALQLVPTISQLGTPMQANTARDCDLLTKERLCRGLSMFEVVLKKIRGFLVGDDKGPSEHAQLWLGPHPANGVMHVVECLEFHRLWSAIQFVMCLPLGPNEVSPEEAFGDGLQWAGMAFIWLLGQERRFEALDFSYHILKVYVPGSSETANQSGVNVRRMADRIRATQKMNHHIQAIIRKHMVSPNDTTEDVRYFPPPIYQSATSAV
ncbi:cytoplasmic FMR1-interacting protein 2-like [Sycon ciliatum]|uniref:cytoplasmic FMR1-interacting protein 2-like n=1 Tax=Sycon ciliatum TaxID=27933 RepID=UPI0031F63198